MLILLGVPLRRLPWKQGSKACPTSTTKGIVPVCAIDGHPVGEGVPGVVTQHLSKLLGDLAVDFILEGEG